MTKERFRVKFKQNIKERIMEKTSPGLNNWVDVNDMSYCYKFIKPAYFIVEDDGGTDWRIFEPLSLNGMFLTKEHTEPYFPVDLTIEEW